MVFVLYGLLIAWLSLQPGSDTPPAINDKLAHLLAYGGFAVLALGLGLQRRQYLFVCLCIVAYSALMEVGQYFVPGRYMSGLDLVANTLGVFLGAVAGYIVSVGKKSPAKGRGL